MKRSLFALALVILTAPTAAHATFSFTEIMYDAPGTDTKHEWVEILNDGAAVDISGYKLFENGTNHGLTLHSGSATVNGYAIIADDAATFLLDFPSYTGPLFDASFSLSNTGESLELRDASLITVASATYSADAGAAGDGNTLNGTGGAWVARTPSPGAVASGGQTPPPPAGSGESNSNSGTSAPTPTPEAKITVDAGTDRTVVVGAGAAFTATAYGVKQEPLASARYVWNFGNGATREGKSVMYAYTIPGTYTPTVDASSGGYAATDRITVTAVPADIVVTRASAEFIEIENRTTHELDLGLWQIGVHGTLFVLPTHTLFPARKAVAFPSSVTGLTPVRAHDVTLYYPNGTKAAGPAPEVTFISTAPQAVAAASPVQVSDKAEPSVLGTSTEEYGKRLTAAVGETTPGWAWASFGALAVLVLAGFAALVYLQFKT